MDFIKRLTSKDSRDYEPVAARIIDNADVELFKELIEKDDFLFDFIKENVAKRLEKCCNNSNYKNLIKFLDYYSPFYEEFISSTLAQYGDDSIVQKMKHLLNDGNNSQKTYSTRFFWYRNTQDVKEELNKNAFSDFEPLQRNTAVDLAKLGDKTAYNKALEMITSKDEFEVISGVRFLTAYGDETALPKLFETLKHSAMAENIATEIFTMKQPTSFLMSEMKEDMLYGVCCILNGLAEIIPLCSVIDWNLYDLFNKLLKSSPDGASAVTLYLAKEKFIQFTENDEYLFDEDKNTKNEVNDIRFLLNNLDEGLWENFLYEELYDESPFVYYALDLVNNSEMILSLLDSENETVVLKTVETLKKLNTLTSKLKSKALLQVKDENIKSIITAL